MASSPSYIPYLCVAAAAFITTFLAVPLVKRLAIKLDAVDYPSKRRINTKPIPRLGGTAVFLGLVVACIVQILGTWYLGWPPVLVPHPRLHISYPILALSFTVIFATGAIDDVFQLKPKQKLAGQVLAALIACIGGLKIGVIVNPFAPGEIMLGWLAYPITVVYLVAFTNIINLIDGLDGLATGVSVPIVAVLGVLAYLSGHIVYADYLNIMYIPDSGELVVFAAAFAGALVGFLWYNSFPAQIFMGDTGSLALGGLIGTVAVATKHEIVMAIIGGLFVMETLSVIIQVGSFKLTGKRVFLMAPIHHHFEKKGWTESQVVIRFWIIAVILALVGLSTLKLR